MGVLRPPVYVVIRVYQAYLVNEKVRMLKWYRELPCAVKFTHQQRCVGLLE